MTKITKKPEKRGSGLPKGMSPYPDLRMAIAMLNKRLEHLPPERQMVVNKWVNQLGKIQQEINHLSRIEQFTNNVTSHLDERREQSKIDSQVPQSIN